MKMSILEMPVPSDVLTEIVEGTIFAQPERHRALLRDIRDYLRGIDRNETAEGLTRALRAGGADSDPIGGDARRAVIVDFFDQYDPMTTAGEILAQMESV